MGKVYSTIDARLARWLAAQPLWFVATAPLADDGRVNVSPRGRDSFSVLGPARVGWIDYTGSGVETIAHVRENGRICLMFCSFDHRPLIVRVHGRGTVALPGDPAFDEVARRHPSEPGVRAVVIVDVDRVSESCSYGVPIMDFVAERDLLRRWAEKKGPDRLAEYQAKNNAKSIDGLPGLPGL